MPSRLRIRNPYPVPDVTTEGFWIPAGPVLGDRVSYDDRAWSAKLDIHERLFAHHTLNSIRRDHRLVRTKVPNDALDLALTSSYIHNEDTLVPKMYVSMQPESLGRDTWRVLRNELKPHHPDSKISAELMEKFEIEDMRRQRSYATTQIRAASAPVRSGHKSQGQLHRYAGRTHHGGIPERIERVHPSSLKLAIQGPHSDLTNPGYSRKDDGTFYGL